MAEATLKALSKRLGSKKYFFGDTPTSLDALAFGYLAIAFSAPVPKNTLKLLISAHDNLVSYCNNIMKTHFDTPMTDINLAPLKIQLAKL
eukprot:CAMPEP_0168536758 /NCGR_PEP_ID=MMETSP0405-20121227/19815_1 /TAXON_ID=498012 /ORGANISM="Trichosphaerium sp, Strain Am-I-7 wt" /LENGTH=89 /DNA_ID=CAMNT_0008564975 /DNA_START=458 /DNA_END=723 /DNA_ORIENTATION=-